MDISTVLMKASSLGVQLALLAFVACIIVLIVQAVRKKRKKAALILFFLAVLLCYGSVLLMLKAVSLYDGEEIISSFAPYIIYAVLWIAFIMFVCIKRKPKESSVGCTIQATSLEEKTVESTIQAASLEVDSVPAETAPKTEVAADTPATAKHKSTKKKIIIAAAVIAIVAIALVFLIPSKFERVKSECVHIAGMVAGSGDYFIIDTYPDTYENMDETMKSLLLPDAQENALEAIKYANEELGFNGSVYSQMMKTTALMGRQSAENAKYRVSWTYHPDNGLEVTYEKK